MEENLLVPNDKYVMNNGVVILECGSEKEWDYIEYHTYDDIKKEFPEFNPKNKNGKFTICEDIEID